METFAYFTKINVSVVIFYCCYWLLFRRYTFFLWNRFYLLGSLIISFILPFITFSETYKAAIPVTVYEVPAGPALTVPRQIQEQAIGWEAILLMFYGLGVVIMLFRIFLSFYKLYVTIRHGEHVNVDGYTLVLPSGRQTADTGSFSFFKWLVIGKNDYESNPDIILRHEYVHIRQLHSLDIILVELLKVVLWINPVIWFYKRSMQAVHEFLADQQVPDRDHYANFLVAYALNTQQRVITNHFFTPSLLKSRIQMIYKNRTSRWLLGKYVLIVPIILLAIFLTAARERVPQQIVTNDVAIVQNNTALTLEDLVTINGIVLDENGVKIPDAIIILASTTKGISTDKDGKFELKDVPVNGKLVITHVKFKSAEMLIEKSKAFYGITLQKNTEVISSTDVTTQTTEKFVNYNLGKSNQSAKSGFKVAEQKPQFPGGHVAMVAWLKEHMIYPEQALKSNIGGIALVQFNVDEEGKIGNVVLIKGLGSGTDWVAVHLVKKMPKWEPAIQNGKPVAMTQAIEIKFDLEEGRLKTRQGLFLEVKQPESLFTMGDLGKHFNKFFDFSTIENVPTPAKSDTARTYYTNYRYTPYKIATPGYKFLRPAQN